MGMVPSSRRVEGYVIPLFGNQARRLNCAGGAQTGPVIKPGENRVLQIAQTEAEIGARLGSQR